MTLLPLASLLELLGILTILANESLIGPIDMGFSVPYLISANIQGLALLILGASLTLYSVKKIS